ncbi:hypothetical protein F5Y17DRAFT_288692 [Xylariaceae sp. FL0594]|nr:hypothetical protein F5Y17DRAFT_288692 [Xylariaceae sp. FL0594]
MPPHQRHRRERQSAHVEGPSQRSRASGRHEGVRADRLPLTDADAGHQSSMWQDATWSTDGVTAGLYWGDDVNPYTPFPQMTVTMPGWHDRGVRTSDDPVGNSAYHHHLVSQMPWHDASSTTRAPGSYGDVEHVSTSPASSSPAEYPSSATARATLYGQAPFVQAPHYGESQGQWPTSTAPDGIGVSDHDNDLAWRDRRWSMLVRQGSNGEIYDLAQYGGDARHNPASAPTPAEDSDHGSPSDEDRQAHGEYVQSCIADDDPWSPQCLRYD